jgi:hypothetical protein
MKPGDLVKYEDYDGDVYIGYIMYLDTGNYSEVTYHIRWDDGSVSDEYESTFHNSIIKVIQ